MTHTVTALSHTGDRSAVALERLKGTRDKVRDGLTSQETEIEKEEEAPPPREGAIPLAKETARRRFDVGDEQDPKHVADLKDALGGAKQTEPERRVERRPAGAGDGEQSEEDETTSRLLRAKKRKKREQDDS